ncbi:DUF2849 domain-containing protein [Devosia ginsengisoli]|uniref:DUF2849 domain-containing protein n=1 Tax=Devosia ginsengisoli TaxID=400770 RepID=A0A5B8LST5_9HYPH|nr:DUF2849 domain-containing protein [Devosia ginsengisoli]QDZ10815.1 DUF2849 domain-containing protein [Devosia ginsengisoli]
MEILTGNELISGGTVYLDATNRWVEDLQAARLFSQDDAEARDAALAATKAGGRIVSVEIEDVSHDGGRIVPKRLRERIRAAGPTAPLSLNGRAFDRQHLGEDGHVSI